MSIAIKEIFGYEDVLDEGGKGKQAFEIQESALAYEEPISPNSLMVDIEGIHVIATRNYNRYMAEGLKKSIPSWTKPYQKPMIMHHNEKDGKIIGRIKYVEYVTENTRSKTPALVFTSNISDKDGIEQVEDGRLSTVSIGIVAHDVRCSICGCNIAEQGECPDHDKGKVYEGQICYWDIYDFEGKELSYVIVPSDAYASNIKIHKRSGKDLKESVNLTKEEVLSMKEKDPKKEKDLKESKTLDEKDPKDVASAKDEKPEDQSTDEKPEEKDPKSDDTPEEKDPKEKKEAKEDPKPEKEDEKTDATLIDELKDKISKLTAAKDKALEDLEGVRTQLQGMQQELSTVTENLEDEKTMREQLEETLREKQITEKALLVDRLLQIRESAGLKELEKDALMKRSDESLKDAIMDLTEGDDEKPPTDAKDIKESQDDINVENPGISTQKDENVVKESEKPSNTSTNGNYSIKESLINILDM